MILSITWFISDRNKSVQNVVIYVTDEPNQETADDICNTIGAEQIGDNLVVNCTQPVKGRYVKLRRKSDADYFWVMYLCEIQVYGYLYHGKSFSAWKMQDTI